MRPSNDRKADILVVDVGRAHATKYLASILDAV
jgi:hypothetical protein